jgi:hypothetical protein
VDDGFHVTEAGAYELVVSFAVEAAPAALPETGGAVPYGTLSEWLTVGGLLVAGLGVGLRQAFRRAR